MPVKRPQFLKKMKKLFGKSVKLGGNTDKFVPNGFTRVFCFFRRAPQRAAGLGLLNNFFARRKKSLSAAYRQQGG